MVMQHLTNLVSPKRTCSPKMTKLHMQHAQKSDNLTIGEIITIFDSSAFPGSACQQCTAVYGCKAEKQNPEACSRSNEVKTMTKALVVGRGIQGS